MCIRDRVTKTWLVYKIRFSGIRPDIPTLALITHSLDVMPVNITRAGPITFTWVHMPDAAFRRVHRAASTFSLETIVLRGLPQEAIIHLLDFRPGAVLPRGQGMCSLDTGPAIIMIQPVTTFS